MTTSLPLSDEMKLTVVFRVEPGCLGPQGANSVDEFCLFAQSKVESLDSDYVIWSIIPRNDKTLPEGHYTYSALVHNFVVNKSGLKYHRY